MSCQSNRCVKARTCQYSFPNHFWKITVRRTLFTISLNIPLKTICPLESYQQINILLR